MEKYWEAWAGVFNFGTLPFYQGQYEPVEGKPNQDMLMRSAEFLKDHGVAMKGHPLCWHTVSAPWLMKKTPEEVLETSFTASAAR